MDRRNTLTTIMALLFVAFVSMGSDGCEEDDLAGRVLRILMDHEDRISDLEDMSGDPCGCSGVLDPVCGSDGNSYVNECLARCAEVRAVSDGACRSPECGGDAGVACDEGEFCEQRPGCDSMGPGVCEDRPKVCGLEADAVCGCNGTTYGNDCERRRAGVTLDRRGSCEDPGPGTCSRDGDCAGGEFCKTPDGECSMDGRCAPLPEVCPPVFDPVCGCDGTVYDNECTAAGSGVALDERTACDDESRLCRSSGDCSDDEVCVKREGSCDGIGRCEERPQVCTLEIDEVCGCDRETYDNECSALGSGVSIKHRGACKGVDVCHIPPGNPGNRHTITVGKSAVPAHLRHGDHWGQCDGGSRRPLG